MRKLTLKWKLFLIANYFQLVLTSLSILCGLVAITQSTTTTPGAIFLFLSIFTLVCLSCLHNIIIMNRYFPDNPLPQDARKKLKLSRIAMVIATSLLALISIGFIAILTDSSYKKDWASVAGISYFGFLFILCLYITILQFQISRYLNQQSTGNINQLIDSIGK